MLQVSQDFREQVFAHPAQRVALFRVVERHTGNAAGVFTIVERQFHNGFLIRHAAALLATGKSSIDCVTSAQTIFLRLPGNF